MLHEGRISNYGIQMKYQNTLFLIYIISYWHHSKAQGHTFPFCFREKGIFCDTCGCQHSPWGQAWGSSNLLPLCCHQPCEHGTARSRCWHTLIHSDPFLTHVDASAVHSLQLLSLGEHRYSRMRFSHLVSLPLLQRVNHICLKWIGGTVPRCHVS